ncbi:MAG: hypothetical protein NZ890_18395, partial [Myxococcota bacterium]|nr:hypothetical protein [Myxococcota bacterium]
MPKRHRDRTLLTLPERALEPAPGPALSAERLQHLDELVCAAGRLLEGGPLGPAERRRLRVRWGRHVPELAQRLADLLEQEPTLGAPLGFGPAELRAGEAEVQALTELRARLEALVDLLSDRLLVARATLYDQVGAAVAVLRAQLEGPLGDPAQVERLRIRATPVLHQLEVRRQALQAERRRRRALRAGSPLGSATASAPPPRGLRARVAGLLQGLLGRSRPGRQEAAPRTEPASTPRARPPMSPVQAQVRAPARSPMKTPPSSKPPTRHLEQLARLKTSAEALARATAGLPAGSGFVVTPALDLATPYTRDTPALARTAAGLLDRYRTTLCARIPFDSQFLLQNEQEVHLLTDIKAIADTIATWAGRTLNHSKATLASNTQLIVRQFRTYLDDPTVPEEESRAVRIDCAPLFGRIEARREALQEARQERERLRARGPATPPSPPASGPSPVPTEAPA